MAYDDVVQAPSSNTNIPDTAITPQNAGKSALENYKTTQQKRLMDYSVARSFLKRLVDNWKTEVEDTDERRKTRDIELDVEALRADGDLDEDETFIPDRVIDENITREQPPYINYLKNSRRLAIFTCTSKPGLNAQPLELDFTRVMTYNGWEIPHYKCLDGAQTHGWDSVEVIEDPNKPGQLGLEHIGHDKLIFPRTSMELQNAPEVIRAYDVTILQLQSFVEKFGFVQAQIDKIIAVIAETQKEVETVRIYKKFCKYEGVVYVAWFCLEFGADDWLKKPMPYYMGLMKQGPQGSQDTPITQYPIFILPYRETEKPKVVDHKGRVFLDENKQEAQTAMLSSYVNRLVRSSLIFGSLAQEDGSGSSLRELEDIILHGGRVFNKPINFFSVDPPDPQILKAISWMDNANSQETNQVNFAAMNREDSRKTAKEIGSAEKQQAMLNSVQLTLFSTHIRSIYTFCWKIVQSKALSGAIKFLLKETQQPAINPVTQQPVIDPATGQPQMQTIYVNDIETIKQDFDVRAAGDVDVIQKEEKIALIKQDYPAFAQTPVGPLMLAELLRLEYADKGEQWAQILETQGSLVNNLRGLLAGMVQIVQGIMKDDPKLIQELPPQQVNALMQIMQQSMQAIGQSAQPGQPGQAQPQQQGAPQ